MMVRQQRETCSIYPIELPVTYTIIDGERISGQGRTLAIGSQIIRIEVGRSLPERCKIRLSLPWPATLPDGTLLNLWVVGEATQSSVRESTIRVIKYEFRTRRSAAQSTQPLDAHGSVHGTLARAVRIGA